jgi:TDG/mug DNA glycosylase family protein
MDRPTVAVYEAGATHYRDNRSGAPADAARFAATVPHGAVRIDLGCGPGHDIDALGTPVIGLDAAHAMLELLPGGVPAVQADVGAIPFRPGSLGAAWSSKCHQHLPREELPAALADLHRSLAVGAPLCLRLFRGDPATPWISDDDLPGRRFSWWEPGPLGDVVTGAGFTVDDLVAGDRTVTVWATRARTLADTVAAGMRVLCCGLNPSVYAADAGMGFARPGNRFWPAVVEAGLAPRPFDPWAALAAGLGMTDLVKRASVGAAEVTREEYAVGLGRVERLCEWLQPGIVCFVGLAGWRAAVDRQAGPGLQERRLGGRPVYLAPSTSGRNASSRPADLVAHFLAVNALVS